MQRMRPRLVAFLTTSLVSVVLVAPLPAHAAGAAVALDFQVQPGGDGPAGRPLPQQPIVRVVDANGNTVTSSTAAVTLKLYGFTGVLFGCEGAVRAIKGIATFHFCEVAQGPKSNIRIRATAYGLDATVSDPFSVGPTAPPPDVRLLWDVGSSTGPFTATAGGPIWFDVKVDVADAHFQTITTGPSSTLAVTLAMAPNAQGATVTCTGGATVTAIDGVARFIGCSISEPGEDLRLVASADGVEDSLSFAIDVWLAGSPQGPDLELAGSSDVIVWGQSLQYTIHLLPMASGQSVAGRVVHIQASDSPVDPDTWRTIGEVTTDANGVATFSSYRPVSNHYYRATFTGADNLGPAISSTIRGIVRHLLLIRPIPSSLRIVKPGTVITFRATVRPWRAHTPKATVEWFIYFYPTNGTFKGTTARTDPDASGVATLALTLEPGRYTIRVHTLPTSTNANSGITYDRYVVR